MKTIKGFENEDIVVSDFGEWVGNDYIDYKAEYKSNQKFIEILFGENKQLKNNWDKLRKYFNERIEICDNRLSSPFCNFKQATKERLIFSQCLEKLEELKQGSN